MRSSTRINSGGEAVGSGGAIHSAGEIRSVVAAVVGSAHNQRALWIRLRGGI